MSGVENTGNTANESADGASSAEETAAETLQASLESVQIVKGAAVDEDELAALVAGIAAASAATAASEDDAEENLAARSRWARFRRGRSEFPAHGRDAWRWSLR